MTRSDPQTRHHRLRPLQIRRARKEDREAIWQIFTSLTRTSHAGKRWLIGSVRKRAVTSLYPIKEYLVVIFSKPTSRDSDRMSLTPASWFRHLPEVAESGERWLNIVCVKLGVSVFERCNSTSSLRPTEQPCVFGKILDLKSSASCRALSAIAGAGLSMFI